MAEIFGFSAGLSFKVWCISCSGLYRLVKSLVWRIAQECATTIDLVRLLVWVLLPSIIVRTILYYTVLYKIYQVVHGLWKIMYQLVLAVYKILDGLTVNVSLLGCHTQRFLFVVQHRENNPHRWFFSKIIVYRTLSLSGGYCNRKKTLRFCMLVRKSRISVLWKSRATRIWADVQRDGRAAEYSWRPLRKFRNSIPCTTAQCLADLAAGVSCSNAANIGERKTWTQSEYCTW